MFECASVVNNKIEIGLYAAAAPWLLLFVLHLFAGRDSLLSPSPTRTSEII
jgi:hypothetical protein